LLDACSGDEDWDSTPCAEADDLGESFTSVREA